jgi:predicted lactoylglutathione lyase
MTSIEYVTVEVAGPESATHFYQALELDGLVRARRSEQPASGFRGFTLSLVLPQPNDVDGLNDAAIGAGAKVLKPAAKSLWGYGGAVQAPDGTIVTFASSSKKNDGPASLRIDEVVLQLGVADVAASKQFYLDRGLEVAKSYGRKYVQFESGKITLTLNNRKALAKVAGTSAEGTGSHRIAIAGAAEPFTDPDGFAWEVG